MKSVETPALTKVDLLRTPSLDSVRSLFLSFLKRSGSDVANADPSVRRACTALYLTADPSLNMCRYC
jgi:hypothetical protein